MSLVNILLHKMLIGIYCIKIKANGNDMLVLRLDQRTLQLLNYIACFRALEFWNYVLLMTIGLRL